MLNATQQIGRLTADPELKQTPSGTYVLSFRIAVKRSYPNSNSERKTDFLTCVVWASKAEIIAKHFSKGDLISVEGSIQSRDYTDRNENKRTAVEISVEKFHFITSKVESEEYKIHNSFNDFDNISIDEEDDPFEENIKMQGSE